MAFFQLVLKARRAEKARLKYEDEKYRSIEISRGAKPRYTLGQRLRIKKIRCKRKLRNFWNKITSCPEGSWFHKKALAIRTDGTFENYVAKSMLGFIGGVFLTYLFFIFFVLQMHFALSSATILCTVIGMILTVGLAFSLRVRCVVFLLLPQFFSKRGRQALMAYVLILALTGPVKNILHNVGVLSESLTCGQEQLKEAVKMVIDLIKQPFYALREAISKVIKSVKLVVKNIKRTLLAIKRLVLSILRVIKSVFQWLGSIVNMCNKKLGTPFDRCQRVFEGAVADCKAKLGPIFGEICNLTYIVSVLCYIVKPLDLICMLVSYISDTIVDAVKRKIKRFTAHMKAMFYVKIKFSHSFHFETNQSKTLGEVSKGIVGEIRARTDRFLEVFNFMGFLTTFFIFFMLLRVMHYRYKWLTSERFDNRYLTKDLIKIDLVRARQDKETVLPLNHRERNRYTSLTSIGLIKSEKIKLARSAIFLGITTFKIIVFICIDYSLYWILSTIQYHGQFETKVQEPNAISLHVSGDGYLAQLYKSIIKAFTPDDKEMEINSIPCLPDPSQPNYDRYAQIIFLIILCWLIVMFEPYGLRIRQVVMCRYYPNRARQRAAWLYNHIIRSRGSFLKFARRQLRRKFGMVEPGTIETVTLRERLVARCPILNLCFPIRQKICLLCGAIERSEKNPHIKCSTPGCVGLYCIACYADLQNLCTICRQPVEYGDLSDISEEKDSSDDALQPIKWRAKELPTQTPADDWQSLRSEISEAKGTDGMVGVINEDGDVSGERVMESITGMDIMKEKYKEIDDDARDTESSYSYSYQEASSPETERVKEKIPFRDIEAQALRDDVTVQIFNEPSVKEASSSSESEKVKDLETDSQRKQRARIKKRLCSSCQCRIDSDSSGSVLATESWSEEVQEAVSIDSSEELLPKTEEDKKKAGRIKSMVQTVARIPCLGRNGDSEDDTSEEEVRKGHSFVERIVGIFQGRQTQHYETLHRHRTERNETTSTSSEDSDYQNNVNFVESQEKIFAAKKFPRYLNTSPKVMYYEINERCTPGEDINALSDTMTSSDYRQLSTWNIIDDDTDIVSPTSLTEHRERNKVPHHSIITQRTIACPIKKGSCAHTCRVMYDRADKGVCLPRRLVSPRTHDITKPGNESEFRDTSSTQLDMGCISEYQDSLREDIESDNYFWRARQEVCQCQCRCQRHTEPQFFHWQDQPGQSSVSHYCCSCDCSRERGQEDTDNLKEGLVVEQNQELIEELMEHDMVREIQEREARSRVEQSTSRIPEKFSALSRGKSEEIKLPTSTSSKIVGGESALPYQQTEAYKNVVSELRRRAIFRSDDRPEESTPFAGRTDKPEDFTPIPPSRLPHRESDVTLATESSSTFKGKCVDSHCTPLEERCQMCPCEIRDLETSSSSNGTVDTNAPFYT